ncbi:hypothetical protein EV359DRAFT_84556 [Lentinula novae-zelandiae]|nr:hypothetical protein EV359DRAFT_84556 [Lentinula novae-zelandiae]
MSASRTITTTSLSTAGPSRSRRIPPTPASPTEFHDDELEEDGEEMLRRAQEKVRQMKEKKALLAAQKKAEEEVAQRAAEEVQRQKEVVAQEKEERRKKMAEAATACSWRGSSFREGSGSPRRPVVEVRTERGKGKARAQPVDEDPDDGGDGNDDDDEDERAPCERCRNKKIPCQMQAGKRSSIICGSNPTGERLAVLESQVAQLLADNRQLRDGQVKANTYHWHFNCKLDWLITDAARRRKSPPEVPEAGPSGLSKKRRRVVDSDEEEEKEIEGEMEEVEVEGEGDEPAPKKARSEKGKEREE